MQKEPKVGGAWEWHQDYGYWYKNQFMFPDELISVMVALTEANKGNGCLQVIKKARTSSVALTTVLRANRWAPIW